MNANGPIQDPDLRALLQSVRDEIFSSFNCVQIGTIVQYTPGQGKARVRINAKRVVYNQKQNLDAKLQQTPQLIDYPLLDDVIVVVLGGGPGFVQMPITEGDECVVLFNDRDFDAWFATGATTAPNSSRMHSLSDGIALVGVKSLATARGDAIDVDSAGIVLDSASIKILLDGTIVVTGSDESVITISTDGLITIESSTGAVVKVGQDGKVQISVGGTSLLTAVNSMFSALTGWVNTGGSTPNPATVSALNAANAQFQSVLS